MDLHPIIVHFPIALLVTYCALEIARIPWLVRQEWFFAIKAALLILGTIAIPFALITGDEAADMIGEDDLVELHEEFAQATAWFFAVLATIYAIAVVDRAQWVRARWWRAVRSTLRVLTSGWVLIPVAIIGLSLITLTGMLGGAIVYGFDADPLARPVLGFFGLA